MGHLQTEGSWAMGDLSTPAEIAAAAAPHDANGRAPAGLVARMGPWLEEHARGGIAQRVLQWQR
eukprot:5081795-Lingulodinium_polyedra.AAC.1